jgi:hypothetical protein
MSNVAEDKLTSVSEPDMEALWREYEDAWGQDEYVDSRLRYVERVRYARWPGQHWDGLQHGSHYGRAGRKLLYEGAPDTRIMLADDVVNYLVALFVIAFWSARIKTNPVSGRALNAAQSGELWTALNWLKGGPLRSQLAESIEIAAQLMCMVGWCVLHPTWRNRRLTRTQRLTMAEVTAAAQQAGPESLLGRLPVMIVADENGDAGGTRPYQGAADVLRMIFPDLDGQEAARVVKELREKEETEFAVATESSVGPELGVLCPWYHFILPQEATARPGHARLCFVRSRVPQWMVDLLAEEEEWTDADFTAALKASAGNAQQPPETKEDDRDVNRNLCELVYAFRMVVEDGAPGVYCTVLSPQVKPQPGKDGKRTGAYGKNWLLNLAHGEMPFKFPRLEAADWCITDTRGVPDMVATQQNEIKQQRDGVFVQSQLSNTPPLMRLGTSASKLAPELGPLAVINAPSGKPWEVLNLTAGSKPDLAMKVAEDVRKECEDRFGIPRVDTPPERSQLLRQKLVNQWLAQVGEALWQLLVLMYQNMEPDELAAVLGHRPLLTAEQVAQHRVLMSYDVRVGNGEFIDRLKETMTALISAGLGNDLLLNKVVAWWMNFVDPAAAEEFLPGEDTGTKQSFREVRSEVDSIMAGNRLTPLSLVQMDPGAGKKLQFLEQVLQGNPEYMIQVLDKINGQENPRFNPAKREAIETLRKNYQHSVQETLLSKVQGRLGVKDVGQGNQ